MKRDLNVPFVDLEGKPFQDAQTLRDLVYMALRATLPGDEKLPRSESDKVFGIAVRLVIEGGVLDLTSDELKIITDRIGQAMPNPIVRGLACKMLEQDPVMPAATSEPA